MRLGRTFRLLASFVFFASLLGGSAFAQDAPLGTPIGDVTETITPTIEPTAASTPYPTETPAVEPTSTPEPPISEATPTATGETVVPAAASPTATPVSGVVDNGDGSYTLTANAGDTIDLDLSSMLPAGGITFGQIVSLSATIVSITGSCSNVGPVFYLNEFVESPPTQGVTIALGDPNNGFACSTGATGNLIDNGARFFTYHADQSGGPSDGSYSSMLTWLGSTNLPGMKLRLDNGEGSSTISITIRDIALMTAPIATLNVTVQLCQTSDQDALARQVDYTLDPFGPAAVPDCTVLDPTGIPVITSLLDSNGGVIASFNAETLADGSLSSTPGLASATSMQFGEGLFGTTSDSLAIPSGGGANVGITLYVTGLPGSVTVGLINAITNVGLSGSTFALYLNDCTGTPIRTATTDDNGNATFKQLLDGTYCVAQTAPRTGYQPIAPIPPFTVSAGQAVMLGPFANDPPNAKLTVSFVDSNDSNAPVHHVCAGIYEHSGFPFGTPSGELAPIQCDTDGDAAIEFDVPIDVPFEVTVRVLPLGFVVGGAVNGMLSPNNLSGGGTLTQDVFGDYAGSGPVDITSFFCQAGDPSQAHVEIAVDDGNQPNATPIPTTGCTLFDATFSVVPYGIGSGYAPITVSTVDGAGSLQVPYTGEIVGGVVPNTFHAFIDDARPDASGQSATFELPSDGVSPAKITILIYDVETTPTATATAEPTAQITATPVATVTPTSTSTVVALPNTGAGNGAGDSFWLSGVLLAMLGAMGIALAVRSRARNGRDAEPIG